MRGNNGEWNINYMGMRGPALVLAAALVVAAIALLAIKGLNFGLDFTGGTLVEVQYAQPADLAQVRDSLAQGGFDDAVVQNFGTAYDVLVRIPPRDLSSAELSEQVLRTLRGATEGVELQRVEFVGPQVGEELVEKGVLAMVYALIGILIYVAFRFQFKFAVGAVAATVFDVVFTFGFLAATGLDFDLTALAAVLAVIGYSLNDTIVVFDRMRENFLRLRKAEPVEVMNTSLNQTMARTLLTSGTTLLVVLALLVLGGDTIKTFSVVLLVGILIGTFSSIYIASTVTLMLGVSKADLMPPEKEGAEEAEELP